MVKFCRSCKQYKPGTIGAGFCEKYDKVVEPWANACFDAVRRYWKRKPEIHIRTLNGNIVTETEVKHGVWGC